MMRVVRDGGYSGYVGIEYEGDKHSEEEGIILTKKLLERVCEEQARTREIFNGRDFEGWDKVGECEWEIEDGVLIGKNGSGWSSSYEKSGTWLRSKKQYSDFRLELQYMINKGGNSGVFFRSEADKNPAFRGYEMQISDGYGKGPSKHGVGSIYAAVTASENACREAGRWNYITITARGSRVVVEMNGKRVVDAELERSMRGYVGLQNHDEHSVVKFKNVRIAEL
jgi:hypothetical protein